MHEQKVFSPKQASKILGVSTKTLQRWDNAGKIKTFRTKGNHRRIYESEVLSVSSPTPEAGFRRCVPRRLPQLQGKPQSQNCAIYARVSSKRGSATALSTRKQTQDGNIERQKERLMEYAKNKGYVVKKVFCETASGINENRKQLKKLLSMVAEKEVDIVLVEFKDRLARFGYTYLVSFIESHGASVEVVTQQEVPTDATQELVEDMLAIVTSFSARLYGQSGESGCTTAFRSQQFKKKVKELIDKELAFGKSNQNNKS